jgi:anti-sigma factor RsiW
MSCAEARESCYDYFERQLDAARRGAVDAHLAVCSACAELYAIACEMTCREFGDQCGEFVESELDAQRRACIERHLSICSACRGYLRSYRRAMALARGLADDAAAPLDRELVAKILARRRAGT